MAKSRKPAALETRDELAEAVEVLTAEVRVLRHAVDELREEIQYATRNVFDRPEPPLPHRRIVSMPLDPCADDFGERINALTPADLPPEAEVQEQSSEPAAPQDIANATEHAESGTYCCDQPQLAWYGDPDAPGIACAACGFPVAHEGDILCWRGEEQAAEVEASEPTQPPAPESKQRELF